MKHNYIDPVKRKQFGRKKKKIFELADELINKYKITNIYDDDESIYYIAEALCNDYNKKIANYESYIEAGMDARLLMELRKSAILPMSKELQDFYLLHSNCDKAEDVKNVRLQYINKLNSDYLDYDWQYFLYAKYFLRCLAKDLIIDYESCFADGNPSEEKYEDKYKREFAEAHMLGYK